MNIKISSEAIDRAAQAIYNARPRCDKCTPGTALGWMGLHDTERDNYRAEAEAAIRAAVLPGANGGLVMAGEHKS
jgi:hypothetical protein